MRKLWLLFILFLTTVSTATEQQPEEQAYFVDAPLLEEEVIYYPIYDSGMVIDSTEIIFLEEETKITKNMYPILMEMIDSAAADSIFIHINSGYRTFEDQLACRARNVRYRGKKLDTLFLTHAPSGKFHPVTARPGYSEHQKGIAFDLNTSDKEVYAWLKENAIRFGFVRTVKKERWHWEYLPEVTNKYEFVREKHWSWRTT